MLGLAFKYDQKHEQELTFLPGILELTFKEDQTSGDLPLKWTISTNLPKELTFKVNPIVAAFKYDPG